MDRTDIGAGFFVLVFIVLFFIAWSMPITGSVKPAAESLIRYTIITYDGECWITDQSYHNFNRLDSMYHADNVGDCYREISRIGG